MLRLTSEMKIILLFLFCLSLLQLHTSPTVNRGNALTVTFITVERAAWVKYKRNRVSFGKCVNTDNLGALHILP